MAQGKLKSKPETDVSPREAIRQAVTHIPLSKKGFKEIINVLSGTRHEPAKPAAKGQ